MSYDEIKKIMIDSLQTEDGKKALRQLLEEPSFRELLILEHDEVKKSYRGNFTFQGSRRLLEKNL